MSDEPDAEMWRVKVYQLLYTVSEHVRVGMVALLVSVWIGVGLLALIAWKLFMLY